MPTTTTGLATSFITFSRPGASGGGATVTDRDGKIKWAGHNLLTNSESFDASSWIKGGNTIVSANAAVAPNGTTTADRISVQFTAGQAQVFNISVTTTAATYTAAAFLKADTASTWAALNLYDAALTNKRVWFNLNTGAKGTEDSGITGTITPLSNGWYFCTVTRAITGATGGLSVEVCNGDNVVTGTAGNAIYAWGAHLYSSDLGGMQLNPAMPAGMQSYYPTTPRNLLGNTEDFTAASWTKPFTTVTANSIVAPNGLQTADKFEAASTVSEIYARASTSQTASGIFTLSIYAKAGSVNFLRLRNLAVSGAPNVWFNLATGAKGTEGAGLTGSITSVGNGWYRCSVVGTNLSSITNNLIDIGFSAADNSTAVTAGDFIYLWGAQLSDSASLDTYVPQYGAAVTSAAYYAPRLDFDPVTLAARGLLVEEQRVNLLTYSNEVNSWAVRARVTVTENDTTSPAGTTTGAKVLTNAASAGGSYIGRSSGVSTAAGAFCASAHFKKGTSNGWVAIQVGDGTNYYTCWFNITNGAKGTTTSTGTDFTAKNFDIINVGGGWYRCWVTVTRTTTTALEAYYYTDCLSNGSTQTTLNNFDYVYGGQIENGTFPTSFIFTVGNATATRAADVASVSTGAFPYSASEGTIVVAANAIAPSSIANDVPLSLDQSVSADTRVSFYRLTSTNVSGVYIPIAGTPQANMTGGAIVANTNFKLGAAMKENDFAFTKDGASVATDPSGSVPSVTQMTLGRTIYTASQFTGWIRQVTYLPRRISNAELQSRAA